MANSFSSDVLQRLSRRDAFSKSRESYLEKLANLLVVSDVEVSFESIANPARCQELDGKYLIEVDQSTFDEQVDREGVPETQVKQGPLAGVTNSYLDAFLQEGLLYHELGHVLFSDFEALNDVLGELGMNERQNAQQFLNVYEDAVIEIFLRQYFDCGTQLLVKNKVYHELYHASQTLWTHPSYAEPVSQATLVAFEWGRYSTGVLDEVDSDAIDTGKELFYQAIQTPNARERYELLVDAWKELDSHSARNQAEQELEELLENEGDDSERGDGQQQPAPDIDINPEDEDDGEGDECEDGNPVPNDDGVEDDEDGQDSSAGGDQSPDEEDEESEEESGGAGSGEQGEEEDGEGDESGGEGGEGDDDGDETEGEDGDGEGDSSSSGEGDEDGPADESVESGFVGDLDESDVEDLKVETDIDPDDADDGVAEDIAGEFNTAGVGEGSIKEADLDNYETDRALVEQGERRANYLTRVVEDHFTPRSGNQERRNQTSGRFDSRSMIDAARGSPRVFKKDDQPDEPDFQVVIGIDESGSMSGRRMNQAAPAAVTIAKAFEDAGGKVFLYRFARAVKLIKTPSVPYEDVKESIGSPQAGGGTSLLPLLNQYNEIADDTQDSFLFVVSDGLPGLKNECEEVIESEIDDPTALLQIMEDEHDDPAADQLAETFDAHARCDPRDGDIESYMESLVRRLVETRGASL